MKMLSKLIEKRRMAKVQRLINRVLSRDFDDPQTVLSGERGDTLRALREYHVEARKLWCSKHLDRDPASLARILYDFALNPYEPLGSKRAITIGLPHYANNADLAEVILSEAEKRGLLDEVLEEFVDLCLELPYEPPIVALDRFLSGMAVAQ